MAKDEKVQYPVTAETIHKYAEEIFTPIRRGECVTTIWPPMAGRRKHNKFIIENIELFEKELPGYNNYLLVYIEPLDLTEESSAGYMRLMAKSFIEACEKKRECKGRVKKEEFEKILDDDSASYSKLLEALKTLLNTISDSGLEVIFFLGEFDELHFANSIFFNNLKSLWSRMYPKVHYVFLLRERVTRVENISKWGELNEAILQNIIYISLLGKEDTDFILAQRMEEYKVNLSQKEVGIIKKLCGGHPFLLRVAVRVIANHRDELKESGLEEFLAGYYELQSVARGISDVRSENERLVLRKIAETGSSEITKENKDIVTALEKLGLIEKLEDGKYKLFGKLFGDIVLDQNKAKKVVESVEGSLRLDQENGAILFDGHTVEEELTRQEYSILEMFLRNISKLKSRDDLGAVLWGKDSYEKYSDWAIDQLVSKLRKKLSHLGSKDRIVTIRGKGYKFLPVSQISS
jgi:DNA-binding winged helix-turn-helix (wHTH) protein